MKNTKIFNFDYIIKEDINKYNLNWPQSPDHPCWILLIGCSEPRKTIVLFSLIGHQPDTDKIYMLRVHIKQNTNFS